MPPKKRAEPPRAAYTCDHTLVVVESPSKCKKIQEILGAGYKVVATRGHLFEIDGLRAINKKTFEPKYNILKHQEAAVLQLRDEVAIANKVIIASDGDREGEIIGFHFCLIFNLDPQTTPRIIFNEITEAAILHAVQNPTTLNMDLIHAQQARAVLDVLVGYKISPILWRYIPKTGDVSFSAGRCQTPALRLIYDNYIERTTAASAATTDVVYKINGYFFSQNFPFELEGRGAPETAADVFAFLQASATYKHEIARDRSFQPAKKPSVYAAPVPFNTSALIQACSNQLSLSPKDTMRYCQTLYQKGYITYMRTDNRKFAAPFVAAAARYVARQYGERAVAAAEKLAEITTTVGAGGESHEAIRPTHIERAALLDDGDEITVRERSVYKLIRNHTLECVMTDAIYDTRHIYISCPAADATYKYTVQKPIQLGWKVVAESAENIHKLGAHFHFFEALFGGGGGAAAAPVAYNSIETIATLKTARMSHYTEASLVKKLEELGIGRPSTFSTLIDTIQKRGYVKKTDVEGQTVECTEWKLLRGGEFVEKTIKKEFGREKNKLVIQPTGIIAIEFLIKHFEEVFSYGYTAQMEERLDIIADGREVWSNLCRDCEKTLKTSMKPVAELSKKKYPLDENHYLKMTLNGPVIVYTPPAAGGGAAATEESENDEDDDAAPAPHVIFKSVKKNISLDMIKLAEGGYTVNDLVELQNDCLGTYEGVPMYLKNGRFGAYVEWGEQRESIKQINKPIDQITLADVDEFLKAPKSAKGKNILRVVSRDISIRKGRFGPYIYYQTPEMDTPKFISIGKDFRDGFLTCEPTLIIDYVWQKLAEPPTPPRGKK